MTPKNHEIPERSTVREITQAQLDRLKALVLGQSKEPVLPKGTISKCPDCGGEMVTTNDLEKVIPTPNGVLVLTRLPGAKCTTCGALAYDPGAVSIILQHSSMEIVADYETKVTKASGQTLGTYFKSDLTRVLALKGKERLVWKVLNRNHVLIEIDRGTSPPRVALADALRNRAPASKETPRPKHRSRGSPLPA